MNKVYKVKIGKKLYQVNGDEYPLVPHTEYNYLKIHSQLGFHERQVSLLNEVRKIFPIRSTVDLYVNQPSHGGFIPIECAPHFTNVFVSSDPLHDANILANCKEHVPGQNVTIIEHNTTGKEGWYQIVCDKNNTITVTTSEDAHDVGLVKYELNNLSTEWTPQPTLFLYVSSELKEVFENHFRTYISSHFHLTYDNLVMLCVMVKNGGEQFESMLRENMDKFDRWTILDTGSTDGTQETVRRMLEGVKPGNLYEEPFVNFRESRNRCLDLAGQECKYMVMLDDTYVLQGDLKKFLNVVRGDQYHTSFTLFIKSGDSEYGSNRITKSYVGLRYKFRIHEVMEEKENVNVVIPKESCWINDRRFEYMEDRTHARLERDLKFLFEEVEEDPQNPRSYYYLGQTYKLMKDHVKAFEYYRKRGTFRNSGFLQERVDALFEAARIANFELKLEWPIVEKLYLEAWQLDDSRPESLYFIGIHYFLASNYRVAYEYFLRGFRIGFPEHCQYSLKPTLSFHFLPKFLTRAAYFVEEYRIAQESALFFLSHNAPDADAYEEMSSFCRICAKLNEYSGQKEVVKSERVKPLFVFVADGGFNEWSGSSIQTIGVGGSETYIIEMARYIFQQGEYDVIVFCKCGITSSGGGIFETFEGVEYRPISTFPKFINEHYVKHCMISRFTEYVPLATNGYTENVYIVLHDLGPSVNIIPMSHKLKQIFCLTEWHATHFTAMFPMFKDITVPFYYGIDNTKFTQSNPKQPFTFIYSSFPNRGLLQVLEMWPAIHTLQPLASLHIYSDVYGKWVNEVEPEMMKKVRELLDQYASCGTYTIRYHGWVDKKTLADAWLSADVWLYPCTFKETFCLTALEAAATHTLVFTNDLAALQNTVSDRGVVVKGDPTGGDGVWQQKMLKEIGKYLSDPENERYITLRRRNWEWASQLTWKNQADKLVREYISIPKNMVEYKGMYGWSQDAPPGSRDMFEKVLLNFWELYASGKQSVKVLEIGTYTGTSLIAILLYLTNAVGYGVDMWRDYVEVCEGDNTRILNNITNLEVEASFYRNRDLLGLKDRMHGVKGDSHTILTSMLEHGKKFDFVYVDGSHSPIDTFTDCWLAWAMMPPGGVMAIDDYLYNNGQVDLPHLSVYAKQGQVDHAPKKGVDHFLEKVKGRYELLGQGYRVFIRKV